MRLLYISNARIPTEKAHGVQIMSMCEAFASLGNDVTLVVPRKRDFLDADPFAYYGVKENFSIRHIVIPDMGSKSETLPKFLLRFDLLSFIIGLLFSNVAKNGDALYFRDYPLLFAFSPRRYRLVCEVHHIYGWRGLFLHALRRASLIVVITQGLKDDLVALGLSEKKIIVAPDAVNLSIFDDVESKESARKRLGLSQEKKIALYIGRIDEWKGTSVLFKTADKLRSNVQIAVIGNGPEDLAQLQSRYPRVAFLGFRPYREIANNQAAADILILPNSGREEISARFTSPLKLFTYMASQVPIVASDLPSIREILSDEEAYFATPDDPEDLARAIEEALGNTLRAKEKSARAYKKVLEYTWSARAKNIAEHMTRQSQSS